MKPKLNTRSASLMVFQCLVTSMLAAFFAAIFFDGIDQSETDRLIDGVIDSGMFGTIIVLIILLFIRLYVFKDSRKDIFFDRKPFVLSKLYHLFPLTCFGVALAALFNTNVSVYLLGLIFPRD